MSMAKKLLENSSLFNLDVSIPYPVYIRTELNTSCVMHLVHIAALPPLPTLEKLGRGRDIPPARLFLPPDSSQPKE